MDIVERLRKHPYKSGNASDAADEIERLRDVLEFIYEARQSALQSLLSTENEIEWLREALRQIADGDQCTALLSHPPICSRAYQARKALGEKE